MYSLLSSFFKKIRTWYSQWSSVAATDDVAPATPPSAGAGLGLGFRRWLRSGVFSRGSSSPPSGGLGGWVGAGGALRPGFTLSRRGSRWFLSALTAAQWQLHRALARWNEHQEFADNAKSMKKFNEKSMIFSKI